MTKYVGRWRLEEHIEGLRLSVAEGRTSIAAQIGGHKVACCLSRFHDPFSEETPAHLQDHIAACVVVAQEVTPQEANAGGGLEVSSPQSPFLPRAGPWKSPGWLCQATAPKRSTDARSRGGGVQFPDTEQATELLAFHKLRMHKQNRQA